MRKLALGALLFCIAGSSFLLAGCSSFPKPGPDRAPEPLLRRGWNYIEPEKEFLAQEAGADSISYSGPVVAAEKLVFGSERFGLVALARRSGQVLWRHRLDGPVMARPYVAGDKLFAGTETGSLYAFDTNGRQIWKSSLGAPVQGSFLMAFQRLYVGTADEGLHAVDPGTGKVIWSYRRPAFSGTSVRGGGNPAVVDGKIWIGFSDGSLLALHPETGAVDTERSYRDNLKFSDIDAKVVGWRDGMLVATYDGRLRHLRKDGSTIWEFPSGGGRAPLLSDGDVIFFPSSDGAVYAISGNSGKEIWSHPIRRGVPTGMALLQVQGRKVLAVAASEEKVIVIDAATGQRLGESSLGRGSGSYGALAADPETGTFYVISHTSRVHEFRLRM